MIEIGHDARRFGDLDIVQRGDDVVIRYGDGDRIKLLDTDRSDLEPSDFDL